MRIFLSRFRFVSLALDLFLNIARLYGEEALAVFRSSHVAVVGLGGVGSWAAEALARSGVGKLTLIDLDEVCLSNINRQLHALTTTVGQSKVAVMAERLRSINPEVNLSSRDDFLSQKNIDALITRDVDVVIDAVDSAAVKAGLVAWASRHKKRLIVTGSSGGKIDATRIRVTDLGLTEQDPLLAKVRNILYRHFGFAKPGQSSRGRSFDQKPDKQQSGKKCTRRHAARRFRIDAVSSPEARRFVQADGSVCGVKDGSIDSANGRLDCAGSLGSSMMVTASFGLLASQRALERIQQDKTGKTG